jgi:hypothetical protein
MRKAIYIFMAILLVFSLGQAQEKKNPENAPARLSFLEGKAFIQRASDVAYEEGQVNMPIEEGDRLGTTDGRAEIYIGNSNYVRLDKNTKVDFLSLPKKDSASVRLRNWAGNIYLDVRTLEKEKAVEVLTSDATFYILDQGIYRIDVRENKETEILVFNGMVEASGEASSSLVKTGQRVTLSEGRFLSKPSVFLTVPDDSFDRFNQDRESSLNQELAKKHLTGELGDFESELDQYGDWLYLSPYGYVWVPLGMAPDWRPYSYGRWGWGSGLGWYWIPYEPWGWAPFHYGRWNWGLGIGWYWIPMYAWGPAWVNWWWDYDYFAWAPLSYWGYPSILLGNVFYGRGWAGAYPYNSRALTVIHKNQLQANNVQKVALSSDAVKSIGRISLSDRTPDFMPSSSAKVSMEQMGGASKMILRKSDQPGEYRPANRPQRMSVQGQENRVQRSGSVERNAIFGYPSRGVVRDNAPVRRNSATGSLMDRFYRSFSGPSGRPSIFGSPRLGFAPRSFGPGLSSRGSISRPSGRSGGIRKK